MPANYLSHSCYAAFSNLQLQSRIAGSLQHFSLRAAVQMCFVTSNQHKIGPETACTQIRRWSVRLWFLGIFSPELSLRSCAHVLSRPSKAVRLSPRSSVFDHFFCQTELSLVSCTFYRQPRSRPETAETQPSLTDP